MRHRDRCRPGDLWEPSLEGRPSFKNNLIYSFVAVLGHICAPACSSCGEWRYLLVSLVAGSGGTLYLGCSGLAALQLVRSSQTQD